MTDQNLNGDGTRGHIQRSVSTTLTVLEQSLYGGRSLGMTATLGRILGHWDRAEVG